MDRRENALPTRRRPEIPTGMQAKAGGLTIEGPAGKDGNQITETQNLLTIATMMEPRAKAKANRDTKAIAGGRVADVTPYSHAGKAARGVAGTVFADRVAKGWSMKTQSFEEMFRLEPDDPWLTTRVVFMATFFIMAVAWAAFRWGQDIGFINLAEIMGLTLTEFLELENHAKGKPDDDEEKKQKKGEENSRKETISKRIAEMRKDAP